jgi:hypothetical protein
MRRVGLMYDIVHFNCSHASWREDIVPDLSPSACKSTRVGDGIPILEAAPYLFRYDPRALQILAPRNQRPARVAERPGSHPTALTRPDAKFRDQESEATRHTGARPDRDAATMRYFLHWPCRTLSWPRPRAILLTLSTKSLH